MTKTLSVFCALLISLNVVAQAPTKTWELGLGMGAVSGPDYRGSTEEHSYIAPIPYVVYRGKFIQSDRDGLRGKFLQSENLEFTLSLSANISPDSKKNTLRAQLGLPELGSTIEIGPALNINLTGNSFSNGWLVSLPVRGVFAVGGKQDGYIGYVLQPQLIFRERWHNLGFTYRTSLSYASVDYHAYYYEIPDQVATEDFSSYRATAGYSGWTNQIALSHQAGNWRTALFLRHDYLNNTAFVTSPLVQTKNSMRGGLAIIWVMD